MKRSLQTRLILGTACVSSAVVALAGGVVYFLVRSSLLAEFDVALDTKARAVVSIAEQEGDPVAFELDGETLPEFSRRVRPDYFQIWDSDGKVLFRSPSLGKDDLVWPSRPRRDGDGHDFVQLPDGRSGRAVILIFKPRRDEDDPPAGASQPVILAVARDTREFDQAMLGAFWLLVAACLATAALAAGVMTWVVRRALSPLNVLADRIAEIEDASLSRQVDLQDAPRELEPVVERLNDLLARLDATFARERAFTSDAAHELRTPLAGLAATLEVCASRPREPAEYKEAIEKCLGVARGMHAMVENLLALARADAKQLTVGRDEIDVGELMRECWVAFAERAKARDLNVEWEIESATRLRSDADKLRLVMNNLLDNATTYANAGGWIRMTARPRDDGVEVTVANSGSDLSDGEAQQVCEPFWRGDSARSDPGHCGLGLSLCQRLVEVLGGALFVKSRPGGTFTVETFFANR